MRLWGRLSRLHEAISRTIDNLRISLEVVEEDLWRCRGLIVAEDVYAVNDMPPYDRSTVDGYAVRAEDTYGASPYNPIRLKIIGTIYPWDEPSKIGTLGSGEAVEIHTGAPMPRGANAVIMYEDVGVSNGFIEVYRPVSPWENVSKRGEDYRRGEVIVKRGTILRPWHLALIASQGMSKARVYRRLRIGIVSVGSELIKPGSATGKGRAFTYASTEYLVKAMLEEHGFIEARYYGIVADDYKMIKSITETMAKENDLMITIAGTSVSKIDIVPKLVEDIGKWIVRGLAIRPGRTTSMAIVYDKPLFLVSGNIVAAWTALESYIIPSIYMALGLKPPSRPSVDAILLRRVANPVGFRSFVRVRIIRRDGELYAEPYALRGSNIYSSLVKTHGYIVIEEDREGVEEGERVRVYLHNPI